MIKIENTNISALVLDPLADAGKLGSRYCVGGYVWQVYDQSGHPLLSGPHYPDPDPPQFDGQGMPEVFEVPLGGGDGAVGEDVCVIGVGLVRKSSDIEPFHPRNNPHVSQPCFWEIERDSDRVAMVTEQSFGGKSIRLRREVRVVDNCVESVSIVENTGGISVDLRWFSHPFFPHNEDFTCGRVTPIASLSEESAGYVMGAAGVICMRRDYPWEKGLFQELGVPPANLSFDIAHPVVGSLCFSVSYNAVRCALWANSRTFSFEPFMRRVVGSGESVSWGVSLIIG